jgi:starch synthase
VKGVLETVKKLGWSPDIIHCHGWMAGLLPIYLKTMYKDDPLFNQSKIVYSAFSDTPNGPLDKELKSKLKFDDISEDFLQHFNEVSYNEIHKTAIDLSDAVVVGDENLDQEIHDFIAQKGSPSLVLRNDPDEYAEPFEKLYEEILENVTVE